MEMGLLAWRLHRRGYRVYRFHYSSVTRSLEENAHTLQQFVHSLSLSQLHFVAHSLGGLVVRQLFHEFPGQPQGRIVSLGSPHNGSLVARVLNGWRIGRHLLGRSAPALLSAAPGWKADHEFGVIAGTIPLGVGRFVCKLPKPNDGTVALSETPLQGMCDYIEMPVSHISMLFSRSVTQQIDQFLQNGCFK